MNSELKCIIVDDEAHCIRTLEWELKKLSGLSIAATCESPLDALVLIEEHKPDIVFLDIEMPEMSGFAMLEQLDEIKFHVVFTTAYDEYAIQAFKANATAYLLKPISASNLQEVVTRIQSSGAPNAKELDAVLEDIQGRLREKRRVALPVSDGIEFVDSEQIIYCQSDSNYTNVVLATGGKLLISKTLKEVDEKLVEFGFIRAHKSYLVNPSHIRKFVRSDGGYLTMSNGDAVSIARNKRADFLRLFSQL